MVERKFIRHFVDILIVGKVGYEIILPGSGSYKPYKGDHGYDNRAESMHPIFYAFGPAFQQNLLAKPFRNVDIYPLMSYLLRLTPRATNGSFDRAKHILVDFPSRTISDYFGKSIHEYFLTSVSFFSSCLSDSDLRSGNSFQHMCLSTFSQISLRATH